MGEASLNCSKCKGNTSRSSFLTYWDAEANTKLLCRACYTETVTTIKDALDQFLSDVLNDYLITNEEELDLFIDDYLENEIITLTAPEEKFKFMYLLRLYVRESE